MNKKLLSVLGLVGATCVFAAPGPFLTIGDDVKVSLLLDASVRYDDNVYTAYSSEKSDEVFTVAPGILVRYGTDISATSMTFSAIGSFYRYNDHDDLDADLAAINFNGSHKTQIYTISLSAGFNQYSMSSANSYVATMDSGQKVDRDLTTANINGEYSISRKTKLGLGFSYYDTHYKTNGYTDSTNYTVPLNFYYAITPKIDVSAGIQYRRVASGRVAGYGSGQKYKYDDIFYNLGIRGELTPKLSGGVNVGVTSRYVDKVPTGRDKDDRTLFGMSANLAYSLTPKTQLSLRMSNDFGSRSWDGGNQKAFSGRLGVQSDLSIQWRVTANIGYTRTDFMDHSADGGGSRKDDYIDFSASVIYLFNETTSVALGYMLRDNSSNRDHSEFTGNIVSISFSIRY